MNTTIYQNIATRTAGDIYIGVVGPVRTGKSTFIKRFMETQVIPNIENVYRRERARDELPQSGSGRTIMTAEPKFVPEEAVQIQLPDGAAFSVRLIDCVGYMVRGAIGSTEDDQPRMVTTPWYDHEIPMMEAAEIGTRKVIAEHSTIGIVITTDGSISDIPRVEYEEAEERVVGELKEINKPFAILLNCSNPNSAAAQELRGRLEEKYEAPVVATSCLDLSEDDIKEILRSVLYQFPVKEVCVDIPGWICALDKEHWLKSSIYNCIQDCARKVEHVRDVESAFEDLGSCDHIQTHRVDDIDLGHGSVKMSILVSTALFYAILGEATGIEIDGEAGLMPTMIELAGAYATIANLGQYQQPLTVTKITDSNQHTVLDLKEKQQREARQIFRPGSAYMLVDMLREAVRSGTGRSAAVDGMTIAGKTGTAERINEEGKIEVSSLFAG